MGEVYRARDTKLGRKVAGPTVLFRASTDLPAWPGQPGSIAVPGCRYPGANPGVQNLFVFDDTRFRVGSSSAR